MKLFLYLGLVTISFAIGDCLQCHNCYSGANLHRTQINVKAYNLFRTSTPNNTCVFNSKGKILDSTCETSSACVNIHAEINGEKADYHFCSRVNNPTEGSFLNISDHGTVKISYDYCSKDLCNGASSMFTITYLAIITVLSLLFFT